MSDDEPTKLFGAQIDADTHEVLDARLEYGEKSRLIQDLANTIAYGGDWNERTPLDIQIENVEEKLARAREKRRKADAEIETYEADLQRLRDKRETKQTREEKIEASLVPVEADLREGKRVFPEHGAIQTIAREYSMAAIDVIDFLKERNPDVPDHAFEEPEHVAGESAASSKNATGAGWGGVPPEERNTPPEKRAEEYR